MPSATSTKKAPAKKPAKAVSSAKSAKTPAKATTKAPVKKAPAKAPKAAAKPATKVTTKPVAKTAPKTDAAPALTKAQIKAKAKDIGVLSKQEIIDTYAIKDGDTGSPEVQIALSSQKIANLSSHLQENPKDNHSRRGLLKIIAKRRRILHYLQDKDSSRYADLIGKLGLKK